MVSIFEKAKEDGYLSVPVAGDVELSMRLSGPNPEKPRRSDRLNRNDYSTTAIGLAPPEGAICANGWSSF